VLISAATSVSYTPLFGSMSCIAGVGGGGRGRMARTCAPELLSQGQHHRSGQHQSSGDGAEEQRNQQRHAQRALHGGETEIQRNRDRKSTRLNSSHVKISY